MALELWQVILICLSNLTLLIEQAIFFFWKGKQDFNSSHAIKHISLSILVGFLFIAFALTFLA
jgi:hypothetical protein